MEEHDADKSHSSTVEELMGLAEGNIYVNEIKELLKLKEDIDTHDEEFHNKNKKRKQLMTTLINRRLVQTLI